MTRGHLIRNGALAAVTVATTIGFLRVFDGTRFLVPMLAVALGGHIAAALTRPPTAAARRGGAATQPRGLSTLIMAVLGFVVTIGVTHFSATTWGIPTPFTITRVGDSLDAARHVLSHSSVPTEPTAGLMLIAVAALWITAWSADRLNFSYRTPLEAIAPASTVFLVVTLLAGPHHRWTSAALFAVTVAVHLVAERTAAVDREMSQTTGRSAGSLWRPVTGGAAMAVIAVIVGLGVVAGIPSLRTDGAVPIRTNLRDGPPRSVVSPLVDIRARLVVQSGAEMFRVQASQPSYWRLMTLDSFDGTVWSSQQQFRSTGKELPESEDPPATTSRSQKMTATYALTGLGGPWAPAAFRPVALSGTRALLWDAKGSTLIARASVGEVGGLNYRVTSEIPSVSRTEASSVSDTGPQKEFEADLELPASFPDDLTRLAHDITDGAQTPYAKAMALQSYFRDNPKFSYSTDISAGEDTNAIRSFLQSGKGFCEQFAGTYAALARAVGLPTRVAVGFTSGEHRGNSFIVYGRNAHAWPEVHFEGLGWLAFEPTPGRGNPAAETYTGIRPQQAGPAGVTETSPTTTRPATGPGPAATTTTTAPAPATSPPPTIAPVAPPSNPPRPRGHSPIWPIPVAVVVVLLVGAGPASRWMRRRRRQRAADTPARRVRLAWLETLEEWQPLRLNRRPADTDRDIGRRLADRIRNLPGDVAFAAPARRLAELSTTAAWYQGGVSAREADEAAATAVQLSRIARRHRSRWSRLIGWFDPR